MTKAIMQSDIEAVNVVVQAMAVAIAEVDIGPRNKAVSVGPGLGKPSLKQQSFHWIATDKYAEL